MRNNTFSIVQVFFALGLLKEKPRERIPNDISLEAIQVKITNPTIAKQLGASPKAVSAIGGIEVAANLLDSYSESGQIDFLYSADAVYQSAIENLPETVREEVLDQSKSAITYFFFEQAVARRIARGDSFLNQEALEYLLRRGQDSTIYASVLGMDKILHPGIVAGFRARQALWDLADDFIDLEEDKRTIGANVLLLSTRGKRKILTSFANSLLKQAMSISMPQPLLQAVEEQYVITRSLLAA